MVLSCLDHRPYPIQSRISCQSQFEQLPIVEPDGSEERSHAVYPAEIVPPSSFVPRHSAVVRRPVIIPVPCREIHPVLDAFRSISVELVSGISNEPADVDSVPVRFWIDLETVVFG